MIRFGHLEEYLYFVDLDAAERFFTLQLGFQSVSHQRARPRDVSKMTLVRRSHASVWLCQAPIDIAFAKPADFQVDDVSILYEEFVSRGVTFLQSLGRESFDDHGCEVLRFIVTGPEDCILKFWNWDSDGLGLTTQ